MIARTDGIRFDLALAGRRHQLSGPGFLLGARRERLVRLAASRSMRRLLEHDRELLGRVQVLRAGVLRATDLVDWGPALDALPGAASARARACSLIWGITRRASTSSRSSRCSSGWSGSADSISTIASTATRRPDGGVRPDPFQLFRIFFELVSTRSVRHGRAADDRPVPLDRAEGRGADPERDDAAGGLREGHPARRPRLLEQAQLAGDVLGRTAFSWTRSARMCGRCVPRCASSSGPQRIRSPRSVLRARLCGDRRRETGRRNAGRLAMITLNLRRGAEDPHATHHFDREPLAIRN